MDTNKTTNIDGSMTDFDEEKYLDTVLNPIIDDLYAKCKSHNVPMVIVVAYNGESNGQSKGSSGKFNMQISAVNGNNNRRVDFFGSITAYVQHGGELT